MSTKNPTEKQVLAAARALNESQANACCVDPENLWNLYADEYKAEARAVLEAAFDAQVEADEVRS